MLQSPDFNLNEALENLKKLKDYLNDFRTDESFGSIIKIATQIAEEIDVEPTFSDNVRERRKKRCFDNESKDECPTEAKLTFKTSFFLVIIDSAIMSISERFQLLEKYNDTFKVISQISLLSNWDESEILKHCKDLHLKLIDDIDGQSLFEELKSLQCFLVKI
jgi:hypothetical protein